MLRAFTPTGSFAFYAGMNLLAFFMIYLWIPETKQLTLEELDQTFSVPTKTFSSYQVKTVFPWWVKRYILRKKDAYCPPLEIPEGRARRASSYAAEAHGHHHDEKGTVSHV